VEQGNCRLRHEFPDDPGSSFWPSHVPDGCEAATAGRIDSSLRSRQPVWLKELSEADESIQDATIDEPQGQLLRQRTDGEFLRHAQNGACTSPRISHPARGDSRDQRIYRSVLQSAEATCQPGESLPGSILEEINRSVRGCRANFMVSTIACRPHLGYMLLEVDSRDLTPN